MMSHPDAQLARDLLPAVAAEHRRFLPDDGLGTLRAYFREIGRIETPTPEQEVALAKAVEGYTREMRREILGIPLAARLLVGRWRELRGANRSTATLSDPSPDNQAPDASARTDDALQRVAVLLDRLDGMRGGEDEPPSGVQRAGIEQEIRRVLLDANLSASLLGEILEMLREREALPDRARTSGASFVAASQQEIGLPPAEFRQRMGRIDRAESLLHEARNELVRRNLGLVVMAAKQFRSLGVAFPDLVQEGSLGLLHAVGKFDYRRGFRFSTYAVWWIRQAIVRAIQKQSRTVRLPSHVYDRTRRFHQARERLSFALGRSPTREELAQELETEGSEVEELMRFGQSPLSLDAAPAQAEDAPLGDFLEDPETLDPVEELHQAWLRQKIESLLAGLSQREQDVLNWRFGLGGDRALTLEEVADRLGISRERVRQIQQGAVRRLRLRSAQAMETGWQGDLSLLSQSGGHR
jgi:RNA polymerase primary sigma factor